MIEKKEWFRPSSSQKGKIFSRLWTGENPKALLIVAHGMAEHSGRYDEFASFLAQHGFAVCMNDHAGHGRSAETQGHFADEKGWEHAVNDLLLLLSDVSKTLSGLPCFLIGHSMGSFLCRSFLMRWGNMLSGCVLCGTMGKNPGVPVGKALASLQKNLLGPRTVGKKLDALAFGTYNKRIENPVNQFAWLSTVEETCISYEKDPLCGFPFTAAGYYDLFCGLSEVNSRKWAKKVPKWLPVLLLAGEEDPVGNYGKGPAQVARMLINAGNQNVSLKRYPDMRHELLNEACRDEVFEDILLWLETQLKIKEIRRNRWDTVSEEPSQWNIL